MLIHGIASHGGRGAEYEKYKAFGYRDHKFVFKYDDIDPPMLHIFVRHLTSATDAINTFFAARTTVWNDLHSRFESFTETHGLYWFWRDEQERVVMVITCFKVG